MSRAILVELNLPGDLGRLRMPTALHARLQELLDRQDQNGKISVRERREALALTQLADLLTLMKLRARRANGTTTSGGRLPGGSQERPPRAAPPPPRWE